MNFNSQAFLLFFPIVVSIYYIFPKKIRYIWLLIASYYFYMSWNPKYASLIALVTVTTWETGIILEKQRQKAVSKKKICITVCIVFNLCILGIFKYLDFIILNLSKAASALHLSLNVPVFDIILPVGISFYTFQAIGYVIDVYRGTVEAEKNILKYGLFISFFPQLVAGPIERSQNLLKELNAERDFDYQRTKDGLLLMMWGFFEKIVVADRAAVIVNTVYTNYMDYSGSIIVLATVLFAFQIYCDFGGYSHIAIGAAKVLGIHLSDNFKQPYYAVSIKEFWRRWHISLSKWLRDYLYIPMGGNKCSPWKKRRNLMITFLISGLWHGAGWNYIVWGGLHGVYSIVGEMTQTFRNRCGQFLHINTKCFSWRLFQRIITFALVTFAWMFFRAQGMRDAIAILQQVITQFDFLAIFTEKIYLLGLNEKWFRGLFAAILGILLVEGMHEKGYSIGKLLSKQNIAFRWLCYMSFLFYLLIHVLQDYGAQASQFIYFQF